MNLSDLSADERLFLLEASDIEQSFPDLIAFVHNQNAGFSLAGKFELAQEIISSLCAKGLIRAMVVLYAETISGKFTVVGKEFVAFDLIATVWSNPYFWSHHAELTGGAFVGVDYHGRSCIALEPTALGELFLDQLSPLQ